MTQTPVPQQRRRRLPGIAVAGIVVAALLVVAVIGVLVADPLLRASTEHAARSRILQGLPAGTTGDVSVSIGGGWFLGQLVSGRLAQVTITSEDLVIDGVPVSGTVVATGVPLDQGAPIEHASIEATIPGSALSQIAQLPDSSSVQLGDGTVTYADSTTILGIRIPYQVTAAVTLDGQHVVLAPQSVSLQGAPVSIDPSRLGITYSVCASEYLPQGVTLDSVAIAPDGATVTGEVSDFVLTDDALRTHGSC